MPKSKKRRNRTRRLQKNRQKLREKRQKRRERHRLKKQRLKDSHQGDKIHKAESRLPSTCERKIRHETRSGSSAALRKLRAKLDDGGVLQIYRCKLCDGFHIGRPRRSQDSEEE